MSAPATPGQPSRSVEGYVRRAWDRGPGPVLRAAGTAFGLGIAIRHKLYDIGVMRSRRPALPVVSVGGVTVGGAGKTPVAAQVVGWLIAAGRAVGVATHGFPDELEVHRRLNPDASVLGGSDRLAVIERLAAAGCDVIVLDDGFQRRKLDRDLDVVVIDAETLGKGPVRYLPAGPYRERLAELRRASVIVISRRAAQEATAIREAQRIEGSFPEASVCRCALRPGGLVAVNRAAASVADPAPVVAVAAVMKADLALGQMRERYPSIEHVLSLPDHATFGPDEAADLVDRAGTAGIVGTLKDVEKLERTVGDSVPLWYMADEVEWETDPSILRTRVLSVASGGAGSSSEARNGAA